MLVQPCVFQPLAHRLTLLELNLQCGRGATLTGAAAAIGAHLHQSLQRLVIKVSGRFQPLVPVPESLGLDLVYLQSGLGSGGEAR